MTGPTPQPETCIGWIRGWSLSAPVDRLFDETASPLDVELAAEPKTLRLRAPGLTSELSLSARGHATCLLCPTGIRIITETPDGSKLFSCRQLDANTLVIEADDPHLAYASDGDVTESEGQSTITATAGNQHIVIVVNWAAAPVRMVVSSGSGDPKLLAIKGRRHLVESAHAILDALLQEKSAKPVEAWDEVNVDPRDCLHSRLRCASIRQPSPWVAGANDQPVDDPRLLYLMMRAMAPVEPGAALGWINNMLEPESLPASTGEWTAPASSMVHPPLLMQMIVSACRTTGNWPAPMEEMLPAIRHYITNLFNNHEIPDVDASEEEALIRFMIIREAQAFLTFIDQAGLSSHDGIKPAREQAKTFLKAHEITVSSHSHHVISLLGAPARTLKPEAIEAALAGHAQRITSLTGASLMDWVYAFMIEESIPLELHGNIKFAWRKYLIERANEEWNHHVLRIREQKMVSAHPDFLAAAATGMWAQQAQAHDRTLAGKSGHSLLWWLNRQRRALVIAVVAIVVIFIGWLAAVQRRPTLPTSVMRTRLGIIQQHYQTGDYGAALAEITDLESRGSMDKAVIWFFRGKIHFHQGEYGEAIRWFSEVLGEHTDHHSARYNLGVSYFRNGNYAAAAQTFDEVASQFRVTHPATAARAQRAAALATMMLPVTGETTK